MAEKVFTVNDLIEDEDEPDSLDDVLDILRRWHDDNHARFAFRLCPDEPCEPVNRLMREGLAS